MSSALVHLFRGIKGNGNQTWNKEKMCRRCRPNEQGPAWTAGQVSANRKRSDGLNAAMRNVRVPLVLRRRILSLCTKVHALLVRNCRWRPWECKESFPNGIMSLVDNARQHATFSCPGQVRRRLGKNNTRARGRAGRSQAMNPLIDSRPFLGSATATEVRFGLPEWRELRR